MIAIWKHELRSYFHSLTAYVFGAFLLLVVGLGAMLYNLQAAVSNFEFVLSFSSLVFVVIVPILTMRVIAEERRQKTDQLLYALPITTAQVILGKYLALLAVYLAPMALGVFLSSLTDNQGFAAGISVAVILFNYYSVSLAEYTSSTAFGSLAALVVLAVLLGLLVRCLTRNETAAYGTALVLIAALTVAYFVNQSWFEGLLPAIMKKLSLFEQFQSFVNGVFDLTAVVYYLSVTVFFLLLAVQSLEKRRYN